ncbi:flagellar export protein FliJ [Anoxybacillus rupiensis]|jgi:flagellar protein FliJ|uniref:Flagellar FliJ protein n=1 Tax=Anoxybacteroides rupiense TaxID=311460 RepID=A0ABT5W1A6_9BACL|nr:MULTISPECIES: flagellar export protein FliJ [Anoxybacillus]KXG10550.1 Flagellar FliJ protein [Anoxybacillus sp. P3H1B]MBB3906166.1 flagellar FliJ protein [Anoxybacillus rupiensis]MBS2771009.1 flagellar biosynthesis chaperone FliJ [Anoxybacillus rupiensis]MDE8563119.1 flagellar export protein FliJ [Anoxybacillus rupiensis]QHC03681.1 flagellar biosynthesis chaperone FliJ [Anoxybacillus sp. PDR2]
MEHVFKFEKILTIREKEKERALGEYNEAVKRFEEAAEKLYHFLKQKEDYEEMYKQKLKNGLPIQDIRHFRQFVMNLERTISHYQQLVIETREQMFLKQTKVAEANIEVKKYEKMKDKHIAAVLQAIQTMENHWMDEISIQQFVNRRN